MGVSLPLIEAPAEPAIPAALSRVERLYSTLLRPSSWAVRPVKRCPLAEPVEVEHKDAVADHVIGLL